MALNNITFNKNANGLGRPLAGKDHYSGMIYYGSTSSISTSWGSDEYNTFYSVSDAVDIGLTQGVFYNHISEYFRMNDKGVLFCGVFATSGTAYDFSEATSLQNYAGGEIRQCLVISDQEFSTSAVSALQTEATSLETAARPTQFILEADFSGLTASSDLPSLRTTGQKNVSVVISKDTGVDNTAAGTLLGVVSKSKVSENAGWVEKYNVQSGTNYDNVELATSTGENLDDMTDSELEAIGNKGYITLRSFTDYNGVFFTDSYTTDLANSDFAYIENNRTIDKAVRNTRVTLLPDLNSPLTVNSDGTLSEPTIKYFQSKVENVLQAMVNDSELSAYSVTINPEQDVLTTSELTITLALVPIGVSRYITINIGFTASV